MAVPDYQTLMAPVLTSLADGTPRTTKEVREAVAAGLNLTDEDRRATISLGGSLLSSRVHWASTYNVGVQDEAAYVVKRIDEDFFGEA